MSDNIDLKWGILIDKLEPTSKVWNVGIGLAHFYHETYLYINLAWFSISIGRVLREIKRYDAI